MTLREKIQSERDLVKSKITLVLSILLILAMARYTDCEIKRAGSQTREAEARAIAAQVEAAEMKEKYLQKLERLEVLGACETIAPTKDP